MTKDGIVLFSSNSKGAKRDWKKGRKPPVAAMAFLGERESSFSLEIRAIRLSAVFGLRRKNVPRGAGYAWTPDL